MKAQFVSIWNITVPAVEEKVIVNHKVSICYAGSLWMVECYNILIVHVHSDFSANGPKSYDGYVQWTLEEMNEFAMKLSFLQCEKHNSQFVDFQFYQELFNVG